MCVAMEGGSTEYGQAVLSLNNCILPLERLVRTPSRRDGVSAPLEVELRVAGCEAIQSAGMLLQLPQVAMATAQILFQRFYYSKSFVKYSVQPMGVACLFLAAKIEEDCRRIRDVINVFHHLRQRRMGRLVAPMDYMGEDYFKTKATVIKYERLLLKELGFCVHVKHPHKMIVVYLQNLEMEKNSTLVQKAWNYMNDSLRTNVFLRFPPESIACACIFLAARQLKVVLPQRPPWWLVFEATFEDIEAISLEILGLYSLQRRPPAELEGELARLRELLAKKQVEIKEIKVSKPATSAANSASATPAVSPATNEASPKPSPKPSEAKVANGDEHQDQSKSSPSHAVPTPSPPPLRRKPIISPIRVSSDSLSDSSSPPPAPGGGSRENGVPEQYRRDLEHHRRRRHKHRHSGSEKRHRAARGDYSRRHHGSSERPGYTRHRKADEHYR